MLKNALIFAAAALVIAFSAPSLIPGRIDQAAAPASESVGANVVAATRSDGREASIVADANGQFRTGVWIEGQEVAAMVDTGATWVALTAETAERLGYTPGASSPKVRVNTANGSSLVSPIVLRAVRLGSIEISDVDAVVLGPGVGNVNLLGASFLKRLGSVEQRDGALVLKQ